MPLSEEIDDHFARLLFDPQHIEKNGQDGAGLSKYKIKIKKLYQPQIACNIRVQSLIAFLYYFADINPHTTEPRVYFDDDNAGILGKHETEYRLIGPTCLYWNAGKLRYLATDLVRIFPSQCNLVRVFNRAFTLPGEKWDSLE